MPLQQSGLSSLPYGHSSQTSGQVIAQKSHEQLGLSEVISALSFALDLTEDAAPGHAIRSCLIGMRIGAELGLAEEQLVDLYYALLLKDIGCSSNSARMCMILGADEREAKRRVKTVDWTRVSLDGLKLAWVNSLPGANRLEKALKVVELGLGRERNNAEIIGIRCERGADIVRKIGLSAGCADAIYALDEHWNGSGYPNRLKGAAAPLLARILGIAQHMDVFATEQSRARALVTLVERSGTWFDPELVKVTASLYRSGALWHGCDPVHEQELARTLVTEMEPGELTLIGTDRIDQVCEAFADVVDAKSPFTFRHSMGVTDAAVGLAAELELSAAGRQLVHRSALLHDLGKLRVSNAILDKPGKLDAEEWRIVREHPYLSEQILARIPAFAQIATIAGRHHEKLDGSGYPYRLTAGDLSLEDRIVAVADIYGALSEDRPYRAGLAPEQILAILEQDVPHKLDADVFEALKRFMDRQGTERQVPVCALAS
jgi:HD-GYP domain-containing protein (c-di-GMP phosphodiesterase class II)